MLGNGHVRFGGRAMETHWPRGRQCAMARSNRKLALVEWKPWSDPVWTVRRSVARQHINTAG